MAHLLYDAKYLFGGEDPLEPRTYLEQPNPLEIYYLTIGNEICLDDFLPIRWVNNLSKDIAIKSAIEMDRIEALAYICAGYELSNKDIQYIAKCGSIKCLKYVHEEGVEWDIFTCSEAAENGNLACLRYAHENGCDWDIFTCYTAAEFGHLDCLIYAHENGCPWNIVICRVAAINGHLDCLIYAHEKGCPWDKTTCGYAVKNGQIKCLKYAIDNGCPLHPLQRILKQQTID